jgi:hypothetical protein
MMPEPESYMDMCTRIRRVFYTGDESYTLEMLQRCCLLMAALALETETTLVDQTPEHKQDDLRAILHNLHQLCAKEISSVRAVRDRREAEIRRQGLPDDVVQEEAEATL